MKYVVSKKKYKNSSFRKGDYLLFNLHGILLQKLRPFLSSFDIIIRYGVLKDFIKDFRL